MLTPGVSGVCLQVCGRRVVTGGSDASLLAQAVLKLADPADLNLTSSLEAPRLHTAPDTVQLGLEGKLNSYGCCGSTYML